VIVVTHDPDLAARASRRVHLIDGRIVSDTTIAKSVATNA
jgi:lipoprotein-releasing system ATP-binding protein